MNNPREWNPYYVNSPYTMNPEHRAFPWLYPYGSQMNYWNLWDSPERMEDEMDTMRLRELYPLMARRLQPYVEEVCTRLEYPGSMMYDEYPDQLQLRLMCRRIYDQAADDEENPGEWLMDLIQVMVYHELCQRRYEYRNCRKRFY